LAEVDPASRFTKLYDAYHARVYAYLVSRAGHQIAEEVASETFLVAWRRLSEIPEAELPWLIGVARNRLSDAYRSAFRTSALDEEMRSWVETVSGDVADDVVERAAVLRALATLSDDDRELLTLIAWHGLTAAEAAKAIGCSRAAYFVRLHRARRRLERALSDQPETRSVPNRVGSATERNR
jgi:RNA polymerase sigma-70 factor, ECF subfamily